MIYSGVDLIRRSGESIERASRVASGTPKVEPSSSSVDQQTGNGLLRFARFLHKEGDRKRKPKPPAHQPYLALQHRQDVLDGKGRNLDIYV